MDTKDDPSLKAVCKKYRMDGGKKQNLQRFKNMSRRKKTDWTRDFVEAFMVSGYLHHLGKVYKPGKQGEVSDEVSR